MSNNNGPLISIIMPAYNVAPYIKETINSILSQTYTNWELLIADDASTDSTRTILQSYTDPRIRLFYNDKNLKVLRTRNKLIPEAKGEFIALMDADDICHPERLEKQLAAFNKNPDLGFCGTWGKIIDRKGHTLRIDRKPIAHEDIVANFGTSNSVIEASLMFRKEVFDKFGLFREFFDGLPCQVYDLAYLISEKYQCENIPEELYYYKVNPRSNSKTIDARRIVTYEVIKHLGRQRLEKGSDDIMDGRFEKLHALMQKLVEPFTKDPSLVYRNYAGNFLYNNLYRKAINASVLAVLKGPLRLINYRTFFYCLRKSLLKP